jgi:hypothetical protein
VEISQLKELKRGNIVYSDGNKWIVLKVDAEGVRITNSESVIQWLPWKALANFLGHMQPKELEIK